MVDVNQAISLSSMRGQIKPKGLDNPTQSRQSGDRTRDQNKKTKTKKKTNITSDFDRLNDSIQKIVQLLKLYGFDDVGYSTKPTLEHWRLCCTNTIGGFMPFMKYKLAAFYAACQGEFLDDPQDVPSCPFNIPDIPHCLLGGRAYMYIRLLSKQPNFHEFLVSILQIKKGLERPDEVLLAKGKQDTYETLTTQPLPLEPIMLPLAWADIEDDTVRANKCLLSIELITEEIKRTVKEVFQSHKYTDEDRFNPFFPSTSANYIRSRSGGGAVGEILKDKDLLRDLKYDGSNVILEGDDINGYQVDDTKLHILYRNWKKLYLRMFDKAMVEIPYAEPVALAEALKVRVITKGPPMLNTVLKPLQKFLWGVMKNHPAFELIGQWITVEYLTNILGSVLDPEKGFAFLSVDYKDATNKLNGTLSEICANAISDEIGLNEQERELFIRALTGHQIVNPSNLEESKKQLNGQLMGSIVSFPILCLINATLLRLTRELDCNRLFTLAKAGIMVNGDDGLLKATKLGKLIWEAIGKWCGLSPSVGKVYYSKKFFNINSTTYEYTHGVIQDEIPYGKPVTTVKWQLLAPDERISMLWEKSNKVKKQNTNLPQDNLYVKITDERQRTKKIYIRLVKYVNFGLLYDMSRSSSDDTNGTTSVTSIGERANELLRTCPDMLKEKVLTFYMGRHLKLLISLNLPWYLPEHLGGLGIQALPGTRHVPTQLQLRIAAKAYVTGFKYPKLRPTDSWRTWKLAMEALPAKRFTELEIIAASANADRRGFMDKAQNDGFRAWSLSNLRSTLVVETLFTRKLSELLLKVAPNKSTIERNFYRKLSDANKMVTDVKYRPDLPLSTVQPFTVGQYPLPRVDVDSVPFATSLHPSYDLIIDKIFISNLVSGMNMDEL